MDLENRQISLELATKIANSLRGKGLPSPGRVLICSPTGENTTTGGIIIPGTANDKDLPRKGVIIQSNQLDQFDNLEVGTVVTYGMYAGKELQFSKERLPFLNMENYKFTILSESEIIYVEANE